MIDNKESHHLFLLQIMGDFFEIYTFYHSSHQNGRSDHES